MSKTVNPFGIFWIFLDIPGDDIYPTLPYAHLPKHPGEMNAAYCKHVEGSDGTDHTDQAQNPGAAWGGLKVWISSILMLHQKKS